MDYYWLIYAHGLYCNLPSRSNPIGDVIPPLQIEVAGVGRRRDAGWCRSELQCVAMERIEHLCRGMLVLLGRRELGLAILGRAETSETWQLPTLLS